MAYREPGDSYAEAGDGEKAAEDDRRLLALWRGADPELQPQLAAARRRLGQRGL